MSQIERGLKWHRQTRDYQREVLARMETYVISDGAT
jgi:hypothetical protein